MTDNQNKLQQRFEQLPDVEPPFGLDTRIKAQASTQLEQQRNSRSQSRRWGAGLATAACAGLAFVIAKPLLETPSSQRVELNSAAPAKSFASDFTKLRESSSLAVVPQPAAQKSSAAQRTSNGGGAKPERLAAPAKPQLMKPSATSASAEGAAEESVDALQSMISTNKKVPALQTLLKILQQHRINQEQDKADDIQALIQEHYPKHGLK